MLKRWLVWIIAIVAAGVAVYWQAPANSRLPEDELVVWSNPAVTANEPAAIFWGRFYDSRREGHRPAVRPVSVAASRLGYAFFHQDRAGFIRGQIALHCAIAVLLALLIATAGGSVAAGGLAGLIYVVHPLGSSQVLRLAGISDLLAMLFGAGAWWLAWLYLDRPVSGRKVPAAAAACLLLSIGATETGYLAAAVLLLWAALSWRAGAGAARARARTLLTLSAAGTVVALLHRALALTLLPHHMKIGRAVDPDAGLGWLERVWAGLACLPGMFRHLLAPWSFGYTEDGILSSGVSFLNGLAGTVLLAGVATLCVSSIRRASKQSGPMQPAEPLLGRAIQPPVDPRPNRARQTARWWVLILFGVLGYVGVVAPNGDLAPPRLAAVVLFGVLGLALTSLAPWVRRGHQPSPQPLASRGIQAGAIVLVVVICGIFGWRTSVRVREHLDWETLVRRQLQLDPRSAQAHFDLGNIYLTRHQFEAAGASYEQALELRPDFWMAWVNLGSSFFSRRENSLAVRSFERAIEGAGEDPALRTVRARAEYNRALVLMQQNRNREAAESLERMLEVFPDHLPAHANLGFIYGNSPTTLEKSRHHLARARELETDPERLKSLEEYITGLEKRAQQIRERAAARAARRGGADPDSARLEEEPVDAGAVPAMPEGGVFHE